MIMIDELIRSAFLETRDTPDGKPVKFDVSRLLMQVAACLDAGAAAAVRHPLGFIKIDLTELAGTDAGYECRLHAWSGNRGWNAVTAHHEDSMHPLFHRWRRYGLYWSSLVGRVVALGRQDLRRRPGRQRPP
jgi:hypothetical protein